MKSYTKNEILEIMAWLKIIANAPEPEFIERYTELTEILPLSIIGMARKNLSPVSMRKFDRLTDFYFCEVRR